MLWGMGQIGSSTLRYKSVTCTFHVKKMPQNNLKYYVIDLKLE